MKLFTENWASKLAAMFLALAVFAGASSAASAQKFTPTPLPGVDEKADKATDQPTTTEPKKAKGDESTEDKPVSRPSTSKPKVEQEEKKTETEVPPVPTPPVAKKKTDWAAAFSDESFSKKLEDRVATQLQPVQNQVNQIQDQVNQVSSRVSVVESEVAQMRSSLPGQIAAQVQKVAPGIVTSELSAQTPGLVKPIVEDAVAETNEGFKDYIADESVAAVTDLLTKKGILEDKPAETAKEETKGEQKSAPPSGSLAQTSRPSTAKPSTAKPKTVQYDGTGSYQRHGANGQLTQLQRPVTGFEKCKHCGAGDGYLCSPSGPCKSDTMGKKTTTSTSVSATTSTPQQEPHVCAPGSACWKNQQSQGQQQYQYYQPQPQRGGGLFGFGILGR